jgi:hypothetical protein
MTAMTLQAIPRKFGLPFTSAPASTVGTGCRNVLAPIVFLP